MTTKKIFASAILSILILTGLFSFYQTASAQFGGSDTGTGSLNQTPSSIPEGVPMTQEQVNALPEVSLEEALRQGTNTGIETPVYSQECTASFSKTLGLPFRSLGAVFFDLILWIGKGPAILVTNLAGNAMTITSWPITSGGADGTGAANGAAKAFQGGWTSMRDLANMFIVLGFVIVGISISLRIKNYESTKALLPLIVVALLVNFSGLFCGLIIDGSNLAMDSLIQKGGVESKMGSNFMTKINQSEFDTLCAATKKDSLREYMAGAVSYGFIYLAIGLSFLLLAAALIARYAFLGILYVLSPLAFVSYAFPFIKDKGYFKSWWDKFLQWAIMGVAICFFLNLAGQIADKTSELQVTSTTSNALGILLSLFVVLATIVVGIFISVKAGIAGSGMIMGFAGGVAGLAGGAVKGLAGGGAKALGQRLGQSRLGGAISEKTGDWKTKIGKGLERVGFRETGSTASANQKQVEDQASLMAKEYAAAKATGDTGSVQRIQKLALQGRGLRGAAAMKVVADAKDLGEAFAHRDEKGNVIKGAGEGTNLEAVAARMSYAEVSGATGIREKSEKLDPRLRAYNKQAVEKSSGSKELAVGTAYSKASVADIREFSSDTLKDTAFIENVDPKKISKAAQEMSTEKIKTIQNAHMQYLKDEMKKCNPRTKANNGGDKDRYARLKKMLAEIKTL